MEFENNIPIYIQLIDYIKSSIISGDFKPGDKLPSVRELALMFKVNPNTVQKALSELEDINLIYTERTNGKFVTTDIKVINKLKDTLASSLINEFISKMNQIGITGQDLLNEVKERIDK